MPKPPARRHRRSFGRIDKLPSGRFRARFVRPDGTLATAPVTFETRTAADGWLAQRQAELTRGEVWSAEGEDSRSTEATADTPFGAFADGWLADHHGLKPRTREHYRRLLDLHLLPTFRDVALRSITPGKIDAWHRDTLVGRPTLRAHAYGLLRTVLNAAVARDLIVGNPAKIKGAGQTKRKVVIEPATLTQLDAAAAAMPPEYAAMVQLGGWCSLRFGELIALRRRDVEPDASLIRVRRGVVRTTQGLIEGAPKTTAGIRDVVVPPHIRPAIVQHLAEHVQTGRDSLLFPGPGGGFLPYVTAHKHWDRARRAADRPDLRFHDLRHSGAVLAARAGATLAELQSRLGHSSPSAAMRYQHAAAERDAVVAARMSELLQVKNQQGPLH